MKERKNVSWKEKIVYIYFLVLSKLSGVEYTSSEGREDNVDNQTNPFSIDFEIWHDAVVVVVVAGLDTKLQDASFLTTFSTSYKAQYKKALTNNTVFKPSQEEDQKKTIVYVWCDDHVKKVKCRPCLQVPSKFLGNPVCLFFIPGKLHSFFGSSLR